MDGVRRRVSKLCFVLLLAGLIPLLPAPRARAANPPNVVILLADDQRAADTWSWPVVQTEIYGKGEGFTTAMVPTSACCPSRASILTGAFAHTTGVWTNHAPDGGFSAFDDTSTLATWLHDAGYQTGLFGKYLNQYGDGSDPTYIPPGWDTWEAFVGRPDYYKYRVNVDGSVERHGSTPDDYSTGWTASETSRFIEDADPTRPVFAYWAPFAVHQPATPAPGDGRAFDGMPRYRPPSYDEVDVSDKPPWVRASRRISRDKRHRVDDLRERMHESLLGFDRGVGQILTALNDTNRLQDTIIVFLSDNGFLWGEHRLFAKDVPYDAATRVPMAIRWDAAGFAGSSDALVANVDVAPTIADLAGIPAPTTEGSSLRSILDGSATSVRDSLVLEHAAADAGGSAAPSYCGIRTVNELYVRYAKGFEEYYRYDIDPWELKNRADRPAEEPRVAELRRAAKQACRPAPPGFSW